MIENVEVYSEVYSLFLVITVVNESLDKCEKNVIFIKRPTISQHSVWATIG